MRWMRAAVLASLCFKVAVLGLWWTGVVRVAREASAADEPAAEGSVPADLLQQSRGFRELLEATHKRGEEIERREKTVAAREAAMKSLEKLLGDEATRLETLAGGAGKPGEGGCNVAVTKVYQSMKAEEAGPILDRLDDPTVRSVFGCMKEKQIGAILAAMSRERAVALTKLLAGEKPVAR